MMIILIIMDDLIYCSGLPYRIYFGSPLARIHALGNGLSVHCASHKALVFAPFVVMLGQNPVRIAQVGGLSHRADYSRL